MTAPWPGNIRQLRNEVMRLAACAPGRIITEDDLWQGLPSLPKPAPKPPAAGKVQSLKQATEELERRMIADALAETRQNQQQAARRLGLSRQGLINKMKRYAIAD